MYNVHYQPYWINDDELEHFGIKGMKWGIRRYQNPDGTLTEAGKQRYGSVENLQADRQRRKETAIKVAKTAAKVGVGVAASAILGAGANKMIRSAISAKNFETLVSDIPSTVENLAGQSNRKALEVSSSLALKNPVDRLFFADNSNWIKSVADQQKGMRTITVYSELMSKDLRDKLYEAVKTRKITPDLLSDINHIPELSGTDRTDLYKAIGFLPWDIQK